MPSNAVGSENVSKVVGYKIVKIDLSTTTPNLPQRVMVFAEANDLNQGSLDTNPQELLTAQQVGVLYGYGSPAYHIMRILRPASGGGIGSIPVTFVAQPKAIGSTKKIVEITPVGVASGNGTHTVVVSGRPGIDGVNYDFNVNAGDTTGDITAKIEDAMNNVLGCPFISVSTEYEVVCSSKWSGLTSNGLNIRIDTNGNDLGITYATNITSAGSGTPSIAVGLGSIGNQWVTIVVNSYGAVPSIMNALEAFNGIPDPDNPTGRYSGIIMKPFIALTGSVLDDPTAVTDPRKENVTISICPAPLSEGLAMEAAANACVLFARQAQDNPHLDISGMSYPDMPTPADIGLMSEYSFRDAFVKKGCSTVQLTGGRYQVNDFVTTYHPEGETPPQFRYCRSLVQDFNIRFGYYLLEQINVVDHAIANNNDVVSASKVIKPIQWKQILDTYAVDLSTRAITSDPGFMQDSLIVGISATNPDRFETEFGYKRSGYARQVSTTGKAGFNIGTTVN